MSLTGILIVVLAVVGVGAVAEGWLLKASYEKNGELQVELANSQAIVRQREEDAKLSAQIVAAQADALQRLDVKVVTQIERIYAAPVTMACSRTPVVVATTRGVRDIINPDLQPPAGRLAPAPLQ